MADFDKIKINGVPYNVKDTATAQAVSQVGSDLTETKATVQQQGQQITQQGQTIAQQGQQIAAETEAREQADAELREQIGNISETYVNVKKYGAVGDGVTDDTTAITNAISQNAGRAIYFPKGTYVISSPLTLPDRTSIVGDGYASVIKASPTFGGSCMVQTRIWSPSSAVNTDYGYVTIRYIAFDGSYKDDYTSDIEQGSGNWDGLHIGGHRPVLDHVLVYNTPGTGISTSDKRTSGYPSPYGEALFTNVAVKYCGGHGLQLLDGSHDGEYLGCIIASSSRSNHNQYHNLFIAVNNANGRFTNCHFYSDYGSVKPAFSVYISEGAAPSRFVNCDIEGGATGNLNAGGNGSVFSCCNIYASFGAALGFITDSCMFVGCVFGGQSADTNVQKPKFTVLFTFRSITQYPLDNVSFVNCYIADQAVPLLSYQPGANASNWVFDILGKDSVDPLLTTNIPTSWSVRWCGSFPTAKYNN